MDSINPQNLYGMPIIRDGDKVLLFGKMPSFTDTMRDLAKSQLERGILAYDEYHCPFDFLSQHAKWFEWHKRLYFDKQTTGRIITDMVADISTIKRHKNERLLRFVAESRYGATIHQPRAIFNGSTS